MQADKLLLEALRILEERGKEHSSKEKTKEDNFETIAKAFNLISQRGLELRADDIALIQLILKLTRQYNRDRYHADSGIDAVNYAALLAEKRYQIYQNQTPSILAKSNILKTTLVGTFEGQKQDFEIEAKKIS